MKVLVTGGGGFLGSPAWGNPWFPHEPPPSQLGEVGRLRGLRGDATPLRPTVSSAAASRKTYELRS